MYNEEYIEDIETLNENIKELFRQERSEVFYDTWADTFEIEKVNKDCVLIVYYGEEPFKKFKKECRDFLRFHIALAIGGRKKIKMYCQKVKKSAKKTVSEKEMRAEKNTEAKKNAAAVKLFAVGLVFACVAACFGVVLFSYIQNGSFQETFYSSSSLKVNNGIRIIQISDLHNCNYGDGNAKLLERVKKLKPDIIICTGDMIDSAGNGTGSIEKIGKELSRVAPLYYIYGNNEVETVYDIPLNLPELDAKFGFDDENRDESALLLLPDPLEEKLEAAGFKVLKNEKDTITVGNTLVDVYGVLTSNPSSFWPYGKNSFSDYIYQDTDHLKITAVHEPFIFEELHEDFWGDLMLCGHTHGGEVHVPILGPLYTREGGLFPERDDHYVYGRYEVAGRPLIVSSGLDHSTLTRINNQPELVVIDVNKF